jgi:hypothetical protein
MTRGAVLVLILAGCSSESTAPPDLAVGPPDLVVGPPDLAAGPTGCVFVLSGDVSGTEWCYARLCRAPTGDGLNIYGRTPSSPEAVFGVDQTFLVDRSYAAGDLKTFNAAVSKGFSGGSYVAGHQIVGSTVTLTLTDVEWKAGDTCPTGGVVHGSVQIGLIESLTDNGGAQSPGHVMLDATF